MGFNNPDVPWREIERALSDRPRGGRSRQSLPGRKGEDDPDGPVDGAARGPADGPADGAAGGDGALRGGYPGDGGDSPAWSYKRPIYAPTPLAPTVGRGAGTVPYAELHCHSNFSFLDGGSHPEELVEEAVRLGLEALALTDHDGFYGIVRFAEAARAHGLPTVFGSELTLAGTGRYEAGLPDPRGEHLLVLARDPAGYAALARAISTAHLAGEKGAPRLTLDDLAGLGAGDHWAVLTACRKGTVPAALERDGPRAAGRALGELVDVFGRDNVYVELWDHGHPVDSVRNDALAALAVGADVGVVATNNAHYHAPSRRRLATALAAVRARRSLDEIDGWLPAASTAHLRSGAEQHARFARYPGVIERAAALGRECAFDLALVAPSLPPFDCPEGLDEMAYLRHVTEIGARTRYGPREKAWVRGAYAQIDHELALIQQLGFPGYFLVVWDLVQFCKRQDIFCQGRGSAANSAVCYALGITNADAVALGLLFERFLSPERDGPPDIDIDIESGRREEVIQYVYAKHGRLHAAQVANVITYRAKSSVRDMAKALGYATGQQDAFAKQVDRWSSLPADTRDGAVDALPANVLELATQVEHFPRHLGIHSGGMVICDRPIVEVCPVEWGRMENRSVLQWDKDDCAAVGLVKFDLLGLGMLTALHESVTLVRDFHGDVIDIALLPQEASVYDMLCLADSVGVFQVESRAQMATLPRLRPRSFYDLVVEVALIRPGPIQGGSVHPYIRRRNGKDPVTYLHPLLENSLAKTLGVPLFQEQLMQMAIDIGGFSASDADQLRQAMGSKRSTARMAQLRERLYEGMAERGIVGDIADEIWDKLAAFANYGFPESHSVSFAYLVYASAWIKLHYPAAFCAGLLNAQPMGFYSPHSLVQDARRHGVEVRTPCINASNAKATLEPLGPDPTGALRQWDHRYRDLAAQVRGEAVVRLGISSVRHIGDDLAERIEAERAGHGLFASMEDFARRLDPPLPVLEALATAGAFNSLVAEGATPGATSNSRRSALWSAGAVAQAKSDRLPGIVTGVTAPTLPGMEDHEVAVADLWATGVSPYGHPTQFLRDRLDAVGVVPASGLHALADRTRVLVAGVVTHRQRPATAGGTTFFNLEDETGLINVIVSKGCWQRYRNVARNAPALLVRGWVENAEGVVNVIAERLQPLAVLTTAQISGQKPTGLHSRDFR
jgi:error-prone DNA polymerase